jgi:hypothetical protein
MPPAHDTGFEQFGCGPDLQTRHADAEVAQHLSDRRGAPPRRRAQSVRPAWSSETTRHVRPYRCASPLHPLACC